MRVFLLIGLALCSRPAALTQWGPLQELWQVRCSDTGRPSCKGQWTGPFDLDAVFNPGGGVNPQYEEIAHAIVLSPGLAGAANAGKVVFLVEPSIPASPISWNPRSFLWDAAQPTNAMALPIPSDPEEDVFCSAHVPDRNGDVVTVGGASAVASLDFVKGSKGIFRLNNTGAGTPSWTEVGGEWPTPLGTPLARRRYYPSAAEAYDGKIHVFGHYWGSGSFDNPSDPQNFTREVIQAGGPWLEQRRNQLNLSGGCVSTDIDHLITDYNRFHMVSAGLIMFVDDPYYFALQAKLKSWFLPVDPASPIWPICATDPIFRWLPGQETSVPAQVGHSGGNSALLIAGTATGVQEVVYLLGGTLFTDDDSTCPSTSTLHGRVEKITNPEPAQVWNNPHDPPDLLFERTNSNTVILLDGSLLVIGGVGKDVPGSGSCNARKAAELYRPPEVSGIPPGSVDDRWLEMATQIEVRGYHSVAGLLPDGRVFSAGGSAGSPGAPTSQRSIEIYSPPYLFWGPRPVITGAPSGDVSYGGADVVTVGTSQDIERAVLVRTSSTTHATDFSQRYIELDVSDPSSSTGTWSGTVHWPADGYSAPPGWYMLAVVDVTGVPSEARWIRLP